MIVGCSGKTTKDPRSVLDPSNPVQVEVWTYYNGTQLQAFDELVSEFNDTRGKELGIVVSGSSQGSVSNLAKTVSDAAQERVGAAALPDACLAYPDTALVLDDLGKAQDLNQYLSDQDKEKFVDAFLEEGDLKGDGSLKIFPVSKSTEDLQINMTDWKKFADATGSSLDELATNEGIVRVAQRYYEWTDAQTPATGDGQPFFGRDALANYLLTGSKQLGHEIFTVKDGKVTLDLDKATMRTLWDNYYVPMVKGYFSSEGRFRSDAVKTGDLICYVGSTSSVVYFPKEVTVDDSTRYPIEFGALKNPTFQNGSACAPQQGAGFVVMKSSEKQEIACVEFLKWFTDKTRNTEFAISAGYVPVTKEALTEENIKEVAGQMEGSSANYLTGLPAAIETIDAGLSVSTPFTGSVDARNYLESSLEDKADADRAAVVAAIAAGASWESAIAPYMGDDVFEVWFAGLNDTLTAAIA